MTEPGTEDDRAELEAMLEAIERNKRLLRDFRDFVNDDRNLTDSGIAARTELERDLEAIRQERGRG